MFARIRGYKNKLPPQWVKQVALLPSALCLGLGLTMCAPTGADSSPMCALTPDDFHPFKVLGIRKANKAGNVFAIDVSLGGADLISGLETSGFVLVKDHVGNIKPYTPVSANDKRGELTFVIKLYPDGKVSKNVLEVGRDLMFIKGPLKKKPYRANEYKRIFGFAAGSGVTPMIQLMNEIINNPQDKTKLTIVFSSRTAEDIIWKEHLERIALVDKRIKVVHVLSQESRDLPFNYIPGRLDEETLKDFKLNPAEDFVYVCGPPEYVKQVCGPKTEDFQQGELQGYLKNLKYTSDMVFKL